MNRKRTLSALALLGGGAAWTTFALLVNDRPGGCVGDGCITMRDTGDLTGLFIAGALLLAFGLLGIARGGMVRAGARIAATGTVVATLGATAVASVVSSELAWWAVTYPGMIAMIAGFALAGIGVVRARALPLPVSLLLAAGALALFGVNDQDARVLALVPFAAGAVAGGAAILAATRPRVRSAATRPAEASAISSR